MKKILLCLIFIIAAKNALPCDIINGSDIFFKHVSGKRYHVKYVLYHQCACPLGIRPTFTINYGTGTLTVTPPRTSIREITPVCASGGILCKNPGPNGGTASGLPLGIEEHIFEDTFDFDRAPYNIVGTNCEIKFRVAQPWGLISTTTSTTNYGGEAMLNLCNIGTKGNNSPIFSNIAITFLCCNQPAFINGGVIDIDRDSLSFMIDNPLNSTFNSVTWLSPWSSRIPVTPYCPGTSSTVTCTPVPAADPPIGFFFDSTNCDIIFTPTKCDENGPLSIRVTEWRKDSTGKMQVLGFVRRDMYLSVINCANNNPPKVSATYNHSVCAGSTIKIPVQGKDAPYVPPLPGVPIYDTVKLSWNKGIKGGTFVYTDTLIRERKAEFSWTPSDDEVSNLPYTFTVTAADDACPIRALSTRGFSIIVKPRPIIDRYYQHLPCGKTVFFADNTKNYVDAAKADKKYIDKRTHIQAPNLRYVWTVFDSLRIKVERTSGKKEDTLKFSDGGRKIVELLVTSNNGCNILYIDTIVLPPILKVKLALKDTFVCQYDSIRFQPPILNGFPGYKFQWGVPNVVSNLDTFPYFSIKPTSDTLISIYVLDSKGCTTTDTVRVRFQRLVPQNLGPDRRICTYDSVILQVPKDTTLRYEWNNNNLLFDTLLRVSVANKYWVHAFDSLGCSAKDTMELFVNDTVIANAGLDATICRRDIYALKGQKPNNPSFTHQWQWYNLSSNALVGSAQDINVSPTDSTRYRLFLTITQGGVSCIANDTMFLRVNQLPNTAVNNPAPKCFDVGQFNLLAAGPVGTGYTWDQSANSDIWFTMQDNRRDTMIRKGTAVPAWYYTQRFYSNAQNNNFIPGNGVDPIFIHVRHRPTGCKDSSLFNVTINPNPVVILRDRTLCQNAGSIKANSNVAAPNSLSGGFYDWVVLSGPITLLPGELNDVLIDEGSGFSPDYVFYPMNKFDNDPNSAQNQRRLGNYRLKFCFRTGGTGCQTCDTITVKVDTLPQIEFNPFPLLCYSDSVILLDQYVNLPQGKWELKEFNNQSSGTAYNNARARMKDSTQINVKDMPGTYWWRYVNVMTGCPVLDSVVMTINSKPNLRTLKIDTLCFANGSINLIPSSVPSISSGGAGSVWSGGGVAANRFDPAVVVNPNNVDAIYGPYKVFVKWVHPVTSCINQDSANVVVQVAPAIVINTPSPAQACENIDFNLLATSTRAPAGITWVAAGDGSFNNNAALATIYTPGNMDRTNYGTSLNISTNSPNYLKYCPAANANIVLNIHAYPIFTFGDFDSGCAPLNVDFFSDVTRPTNFPVTYDWDFGNGTNSTDANPAGILFNQHGKYEVKLSVKNSAGDCETRDSAFFVDVFPVPVASMVSSPDFYTTIALPRFQFTSTSAVATGNLIKYEWNFGTGNPQDTANTAITSFAYSEDTAEYIISLRVTSDKGCIHDTVKRVKIGPDITVFIPSAFSPDGAGPGRNNKFFVVAQGYIGYNMQIFNRWGERLFESNHPENEPWDGTYKGESVQMDVYMYYAKVIAFDGKEYEYSGTVSLIK